LEAAIGAFKLADRCEANEDKYKDWMNGLRDDGLLHCRAEDGHVNEPRAWGRVVLPLASGPTFAPSWLNHSLTDDVARLIETCCGLEARSVFGRLYPSEHVSVLHQSHALCVPLASVDEILSSRAAARLSECQIELNIVRRIDVFGQLCGEGHAVCRIDLVRGGHRVELHLLHGCAILPSRVTPPVAALGASSHREEPRVACPQTYTTAEWERWQSHLAESGHELPALDCESETAGLRTLRSLLQRTLGLLRQHTVPVCLGFGTLLGKIRQDDVMAHDHDCDLLLAAADVGAVLELSGALREVGLVLSLCTGQLAHDGGEDEFVEEFGPGRPLPPSHEINQLKVYDRAAWEQGAQGWCFCDLLIYEAVGEHVRIRDDHCYLTPLPLALMLPLRPIRFLGEACFEPRDAHAWLGFQYGEDWTVPSATMGWLSTGGRLFFDHA
jgi:hypothetical protein